MNTKQIFDLAVSNKGVTINPTTYKIPTEGFAVSIPNKDLQVSEEYFNPKVLQNFIDTNKADLVLSNAYVGVWINKSTVYLDISLVTNDLEEAILLGILGHQKAIFDLARNKEIFLPAPQTSGTITQQMTYASMKSREVAQSYKEAL